MFIRLARQLSITASLAFTSLAACDAEPTPPVTTVFEVEGMTCESCARGITKSLKLAEGIESVKVDLKEETAIVVHDAETIAAADIKARIERMGYRATRVVGPAAAKRAPKANLPALD